MSGPPSSRREALVGGGRRVGLALAAASMPAVFAAAARQARAQDVEVPSALVEVLNVALTLERLEASFYQQGLDKRGLIPPADEVVFSTLGRQEAEHVELLEGLLGDEADPAPEFDFTAGGRFPTFADYETYKLLAEAFEETGVRAYKGAAIAEAARPFVEHPKILTRALRIHSVEARHAARVRRLRGRQAWSWRPLDMVGTPPALRPIYATDESLTEEEPSWAVTEPVIKYGVDVAGVGGVSPREAGEAFDEPLGMASVLELVEPFVVGS
ncbi:MAG TPA: ferritin-like domain-containing protein [Solirubrobacteraceae bacterium]|nr:ferritin-like domain-containing protein [Solirubrobacteraceae bacterium]